MKKREKTPEHLINLKKIREMKGIRSDEKKGIRIGALTTLAELERSTLVKEKFSSPLGCRHDDGLSPGQVAGNHGRKFVQCCPIGRHRSSVDCARCFGKNGGAEG